MYHRAIQKNHASETPEFRQFRLDFPSMYRRKSRPLVIQKSFDYLSLNEQEGPETLMNWPTHASKHRINDTVYGVVKVPSPIDKILDQEEFQRLRHLKQTGLVNLVFPNCEHSRFVHSLGTFSLAFRLVDKLKHSQPTLNITAADHLCTSIAALLHDVGHGPFSHLFDGAFAERCGRSFKHEEMSVKIVDRIMRKPDVREALEPILTADAYESSIGFIKELITAKPFAFTELNEFKNMSDEEKKEVIQDEWRAVVSGRGVDKSFLYDIVNNTDSGHDVDKMDYLLRDSKASGVAITFSDASINRLFDHVRVVVDPNSGLLRIGYSKKCEGDIKSVGDSRQLLHSHVYQHKAVRFIETLVVDALHGAGEILEYKGTDGRMFKLNEVMDDVDAYLKTTDHVVQEIINHQSTDPRMLAAQDALRRVQRRDIGCKLGCFELNMTRANLEELSNNEKGTLTESVRLVRERMADMLQDCQDEYLVMHSVLGRGLDRKTHPIERQVFYDGKPHESEHGGLMMGSYVDEDYITNNCPLMATKWEIFVMGCRRSLSDEKKMRIKDALRRAGEELKFLTPRKRQSDSPEVLPSGPSTAKRALFST